MAELPVPATTTPNRTTRVEFDIDSTEVIEGPWGGVRPGYKIAEQVGLSSGGGGDNQFATGVRYWPASGTWTLAPLQERMSDFHEKLPAGVLTEDLFYTLGAAEDALHSDTADSLVNLMRLTAGIKLAQVGIYHTRRLPGSLGFEPGTSSLNGILDRGDFLYKKRVEAGKTWAQDAGFNLPLAPQNQFSSPPGILSLPGLPPANIAVDKIVSSVTSQRADQGFFLRWSVPGTQHQFPDYILNFWFGQFIVVVKGDGLITLLENCRPKPGQAKRIVYRYSWRYCQPGQAVGNTHTLLIYPQIGPRGDKYIHFANNQLDAANVYGATGNASETSYITNEVARQGDVDEAGRGHVTTEDIIRLDHRRDLEVSWQLSRLLFTAKGTLRDAPFAQRPYKEIDGTYRKFEFSVYRRLPRLPDGSLGGPYDVTGQMFDVKSGVSYLPGNNATWSVEYPACELTFSGTEDAGVLGACSDTPILNSYRVWQDAQTRRNSPGVITQTGVLDVSIEGADREPQNERCMVSLHDPSDAMKRLRLRGEISGRVIVNMPTPGTNDSGSLIDVVLFRGYAIKPHRTHVGRYTAEGMRLGQRISDNSLFSAEQSHYDLSMVGMWRALNSDRRNLAQAGQYHRYSIDEKVVTPPSGEVVPWKVTDVIRDILKQAGFPAGMINIPDLFIRLWSGENSLNSDFELTVETDMLRQLIRLSNLYLGATLIFDPTAGTEGQWRLTQNAGVEGLTPLFNFHSYSLDGAKLPHDLHAYPVGHGFCTGPIESYTVAPEYNRIRVVASSEGLISGTNKKLVSVSSEIRNLDSYTPAEVSSRFVAGSGLRPNPESPHYLGHEQMYFHVDSSLMGSGDDAFTEAKRACDYTCLRLFDLIGKARQIQPLNAPLYVVQDAETLRWRMMRYGDPVTLDGVNWTVRNCNADYKLDSHQTAYYELERIVPLSYQPVIIGGAEA